MNLLLKSKRTIATGIEEFEFVASDGADLPRFTAGSHIPIETPSGAMRHYSLSNDPAEENRYVIAVKREQDGRGGSLSMVDDATPGTVFKALPPENDFPLADAPSYILIAGGIGITPILSMARVLSAASKPFKLIYCTRSADMTAYQDVLKSEAIAGDVTIHHDQGDPDQVFDFWDLLEEPDKSHVYCCGPKPLMEEVRGVTGHWPETAIHFEDFKPVDMFKAEDIAFDVVLKKSGQTVSVAVGQTILSALRDAGISRASSCESGTCGTCKTAYLSGDIDHRDMVLLPEERDRQIMICVSRAKSGEVVLDL